MNKRKRSGVMLAKPLTYKLLSKMRRVILQPKLNGIRCRITLDPTVPKLFSSTGRLITSMKHIEAELYNYARTVDAEYELVLDGELYRHGWSHQHLRSVVLRDNPHPEMEEVEYHIFDTISASPQRLRLTDPNDFEDYKHLCVVDTGIGEISDASAAGEFMKFVIRKGNEYVSQGYEGVIVRDADALYETKRSNYLLKWKPKHKEWFNITGLHAEVAEDGTVRAKLGALDLMPLYGDEFEGKPARNFKCGGGRLSHDQRRKAWVDLRTRSYTDFKAYVAYPELTERGVPSQPILLEIKRR